MSDSNWLKEPDPSGDAVVYISIPEGVKLTPDLTEALENLSKAMNTSQDGPLTKSCPGVMRRCTPFGNCYLATNPGCFIFTTCQIKK